MSTSRQLRKVATGHCEYRRFIADMFTDSQNTRCWMQEKQSVSGCINDFLDVIILCWNY